MGTVEPPHYHDKPVKQRASISKQMFTEGLLHSNDITSLLVVVIGAMFIKRQEEPLLGC